MKIKITLNIESDNSQWERAFIQWLKDQLYYMKKDFESRSKSNKINWTIGKKEQQEGRE